MSEYQNGDLVVWTMPNGDRRPFHVRSAATDPVQLVGKGVLDPLASAADLQSVDDYLKDKPRWRARGSAMLNAKLGSRSWKI